jgi:hypothetical protein
MTNELKDLYKRHEDIVNEIYQLQLTIDALRKENIKVTMKIRKNLKEERDATNNKD